MSKYTTEVRFICEQAAGYTESQGYSKTNEIIQAAIPKVFDFDFPIFDSSYRNVLCTKILRHYYTREICEETVGLWKFRLETRLNEIMPYYNKLYKSELIDFNPLYDTELTTENSATKEEKTEKTEKDTEARAGKSTNNRGVEDNATTKNEATNNTTDSGTTTNSDEHRDLYSDTPQGSLQNVENETYLTNARKVTDKKNETRNNTGSETSTGNTTYNDKVTEKNDGSFNEDSTINRTGNTTLNSTDSYIHKITGKSGGQSYSKMIEEFRNTFLNLDVQVINELNDLFICLW